MDMVVLMGYGCPAIYIQHTYLMGYGCPSIYIRFHRGETVGLIIGINVEEEECTGERCS